MAKLVKVFKVKHISSKWSVAMAQTLAPFENEYHMHNDNLYQVKDVTIQYGNPALEGVHEIRYTLVLEN